MTKEEALEIWDDIYGDELWAQDCFGTWIYRNDYGKYDTYRKRRKGTNKEYNYCWEIDHIMPKSKFVDQEDADFLNNYEIMHHLNNKRKSDNTNFEINGIKYKVVSCEICKKHNLDGYGIENCKTNKRVDWKYIRKAYYEIQRK